MGLFQVVFIPLKQTSHNMLIGKLVGRFNDFQTREDLLGVFLLFFLKKK